MRHLEPLVDAAISYMESHLPGKITALNAELGGFELEAPKAYLFGGATIVTAEDTPTIEVAATDWSLGDFSIGMEGGGGTATIMVRAFLADLDFERLYRKTMRYGRVILDTMLQYGAFGPGERVLATRGFYRVNPETNEMDEYLAGTLVVFSLDTFERVG